MSDDNIPIEAVLFKKGSKIGFLHKRVCELDRSNNQLIIYKNAKKSKIERKIELTSDCIITKKDIPTQKKSFTLNLIHPDKTFNFMTENKSSRDNFFISLREAILSTPGLTMNCFDIISVLGRGYFGKVILCRRKNTNSLYAIKAIKKKNLQEEDKLRTAIIEREVFRKCDNPFIVKIHFAFDTESKIYLGLEYVGGGNLQHHMEEEGKTLPMSDIKLYLAEVAIAVNYLHQKGIIYRDLKCSNILLDYEGHIKLTDFGLSAFFEDPTAFNTTNSFVGTPECIPPEMIQRYPYSYEVDWWQYGILAYELIFKEKPFRHPNNNKLFENICTTNPIFPFDRSNSSNKVGLVHSKSLTASELQRKATKIRKDSNTHHHSKYSMSNFNQNSVKVRTTRSLPVPDKDKEKSPKKTENNTESTENDIIFSFITSLLQKNPKNRMKFDDIIKHPFFDGIDFQEVADKKLRPSYIPPKNELNIDDNFKDECPADSYASTGSGIPSSMFADFSFIDSNNEDLDDDDDDCVLQAINDENITPTEFDSQ